MTDLANAKDRMPCFMLVVGDDKQEQLINLSQIRVLQKLGDEHVRILFDPNFTLEFHGKGAMQILGLCMAYSLLADGTPVSEIVEKKMASS